MRMMNKNEVLSLARGFRKTGDQKQLSNLIEWFQGVARKRYPYYRSGSTCLDYDDFDAFLAEEVWKNISSVDEKASWIGYVLRCIRNRILYEVKKERTLEEVFSESIFSVISEDDNYIWESEEYCDYFIKELEKKLEGRAVQLFRMMLFFPTYSQRRLALILKIDETRVSQLLRPIREEARKVLQMV